jgi:hypothetical protein
MVEDGLALGRTGGCPVSRGDDEPRVLGMIRRDLGRVARHDEEPKHILGFPADLFGPVEGVRLRALRHPIKAYKRRMLIRRLGPYAPDDEDDQS